MGYENKSEEQLRMIMKIHRRFKNKTYWMAFNALNRRVL